jgi:hypothetical protein
MMKEIDLTVPQGAIFSEDGKYRYALWRVWSTIRKPLCFNGLNPSTANHTMNDPTVIRLMFRADNAGFGGLLVSNLYGLVSSDPSVLLDNGQAVGTETDSYIRQMIELADGKVLCGWGSFPAVKLRAETVLKMIPKPYCLGVNKDGQPKHPLYIGYEVPMVKYKVSND